MPQIRAVLFDFGLVLSGPPDPLSWQRIQAILQTTDAALHESYWRHRHDYDLGVLTGTDFWRTVAAELNHPLTRDELTELLATDVILWTQPNQPMIDWALALQNANIATGILSNMGDAMETGILERCAWMAGFPHHTFSHRLRIAKPDERIYQHALSGVGQPAHATLFIDDRIENIQAARALGMHAIHYPTHDALLHALEEINITGLPLPAAV